MAEDKNVKQQEGLLSSIRKGLANLYGRTYYTPPDGDSELTHLPIESMTLWVRLSMISTILQDYHLLVPSMLKQSIIKTIQK